MKKHWRKLLKETLHRLRSERRRAPRVAVVGIGQELRGDDAAGIAVVRAIRRVVSTSPNGLALDAGAAPENQVGPLRRFAPDLVLFIDAAQMGERAGTVRWFSPDETTGLSASTHTLPPAVIAQYLKLELGCEVALLGIQPEQSGIATPVSESVQAAIADVVRVLAVELLTETRAYSDKSDSRFVVRST